MNKRNLVIILAALGSAAVAAPAAAQKATDVAGPWYIGLGLGQSFGSGGNSSGTIPGTAIPFTSSGFDDNKTSFQVNGGYQFTPEWGIEVQYTWLGERSGNVTAGGVTASASDVKLYQWGVAGTYTMAFTDQWFGRGKLGVSSNHIDSTTAVIPGVGTANIGGGSKTDLLAGIGVGYRWNANFSTRLEYEYFGKFESNNGNQTSNVKANNIGLRMQYNF
jgi:opacity protein-like surface antigen